MVSVYCYPACDGTVTVAGFYLSMIISKKLYRIVHDKQTP